MQSILTTRTLNFLNADNTRFHNVNKTVTGNKKKGGKKTFFGDGNTKHNINIEKLPSSLQLFSDDLSLLI